jgi:hypothetical protein
MESIVHNRKMEQRMRLHKNIHLFRQAMQFTSDKLKTAATYIEKDYWVTYALHTIFHNEIGKDTREKMQFSSLQITPVKFLNSV